jgi:hypothetical protein
MPTNPLKYLKHRHGRPAQRRVLRHRGIALGLGNLSVVLGDQVDHANEESRVRVAFMQYFGLNPDHCTDEYRAEYGESEFHHLGVFYLLGFFRFPELPATYSVSHKNVPKKGGGIRVVSQKRSAIGTHFFDNHYHPTTGRKW